MNDKKNHVRNTTAESRTKEGAMEFLTMGMALGGSAAIEMQEARGQAELTTSEVLPTKGTEDAKPWEAMGIKLGKPVEGDPIFRHATLPAGWKKVATDHSMWSKLVDDKGRERAGIFYKAAFHDRSSAIHLSCRFSASYEMQNQKTWDGKAFAVVKDCGKEIWRSEAIEETKAVAPNYETHTNLATKQARNWLSQNGYPDFKNPGAYWD